MKKFEYKVLHYYEEFDEETTRQWNELGMEGWELVRFAPYAMEVSNEINEFDIPIPGTVKGKFSWVAAAFKREITEDL